MGGYAQADPLAGMGTPVGPPPPAAGAGADPLAGLGTPVGAAPAAAATAPTMEQRFRTVEDNAMAPEVGPVEGLVKGGMHTVAGLLNILGDHYAASAAEDGPDSAYNYAATHVKSAADWLNTHSQDHGVWQHIGDFGESALELMTPEGLAGLAGDAGKAGEVAGKTAEVATKAKRLADASSVAKTLDAYPRIKALVMIGARAVKAGAEVGGQTYVKTGGDLPAAGEAAATGAVLGGGAAALGEGFAAARTAENTRQVTTAAHEAAPAVLAERTAADAAARQAAAQQGVKDVAQRATQDALERLNATREPVMVQTSISRPSGAIPARAGAEDIDQGIASANAKAQLGSTASTVPTRLMPQNPIVRELGPQAALVPDRIWGEIPGGDGIHAETVAQPNFAPIDAAKESSDVRSFGDAAEKIRAAAQPVYEQLNNATNGKFNDLRLARTAAYKAGDAAARREADLGIEKLLENKPKGVSAEDYATAKSAWADTKTLDRLHQAVEGSFNGVSEDIAAQPGTPERLLRSGSTQGSNLQINLGNLLRSRDMAGKVEQLIGKDGIANLYRASALVSKPETAKATAALAEQVAAEFPAPETPGGLHRVPGAAVGASAGAAVGHAVAGGAGASAGAVLGAAAGGALSDGARDVMRKMVMSPRVGQLMDFAVRNNVSPKVAAMAIAAEIRREQGETK